MDGASFSIHEGEIFGFLGPNGAGKTTTINMLTGLARSDEGSIRIGGIDCIGKPKAAQHLIGVVPDESNLHPELTGFDNLCFCAALYGMRKQERETCARELLRTFCLTDAGKRKFGGFSKGMKRKLAITAGIIHNPSILFLDEPTTGIDVVSARQIRQFLAKLNQGFQGLFIAVPVSEVFEAQTFSNFFGFPMIFLCGLFFPIERLPVFLRPLSYVLLLTYGADILHGAFSMRNTMSIMTDFALLIVSCTVLFFISLRDIKRRRIT